jgi:hypothetical protein
MRDKRPILRQGDVLLVPIRSAPQARIPVRPENGRLVLAHGEATGHHHSFRLEDRLALFREDGSGGGLFLVIGRGEPAALEHQEHHTLRVAPGAYKVLRQRTMSSGIVSRVAD